MDAFMGIDFLTKLTDDGLESLIYMAKAEQQRRSDKRRAERMASHQCETLEEIRRCPICCVP